MGYLGYSDLELYTLYLFEDGDTWSLHLTTTIHSLLSDIKSHIDGETLLSQFDVCYLHLLHDGFLEMAHEIPMPYHKNRMEVIPYEDAVAFFPLAKHLYITAENELCSIEGDSSVLSDLRLVLTDKAKDFLKQYPNGLYGHSLRIRRSYDDTH